MFSAAIVDDVIPNSGDGFSIKDYRDCFCELCEPDIFIPKNNVRRQWVGLMITTHACCIFSKIFHNKYLLQSLNSFEEMLYCANK